MHVATLKVVLSCARHECEGYQKQFNTRWGLTLIFHDNNIVVLQKGKNKYLLAHTTTSLRVCACLGNARIELMYGPKFIMNMIIKQPPLVQIIGPVLLLLPLGVIRAFSVSNAGNAIPPGMGQVWWAQTLQSCFLQDTEPNSLWLRAVPWKPTGLHRGRWCAWGRRSFWAALVYLKQQINVCGTLINVWCTPHFSLSC